MPADPAATEGRALLTREPPVIGWLDAVPVARTVSVTHLAEVLDGHEHYERCRCGARDSMMVM